MDLDLAERGAVEREQRAVQNAVEIFIVQPCDELRNFLLCNGRRQVNIPRGQAGEGFRIAREQAMQEGRTAAQVAENEERLFDGMVFVIGEEDVIQPEAEPVDQRSEGPDDVEKKEEGQAFFCKRGSGVFMSKKGAVERAPEQPEVISHSGRDP